MLHLLCYFVCLFTFIPISSLYFIYHVTQKELHRLSTHTNSIQFRKLWLFFHVGSPQLGQPWVVMVKFSWLKKIQLWWSSLVASKISSPFSSFNVVVFIFLFVNVAWFKLYKQKKINIIITNINITKVRLAERNISSFSFTQLILFLKGISNRFSWCACIRWKGCIFGGLYFRRAVFSAGFIFGGLYFRRALFSAGFIFGGLYFRRALFSAYVIAVNVAVFLSPSVPEVTFKIRVHCEGKIWFEWIRDKFGSRHGVLYYRPTQHACDFCI